MLRAAKWAPPTLAEWIAGLGEVHRGVMSLARIPPDSLARRHGSIFAARRISGLRADAGGDLLKPCAGILQ
jgi:hypothetical protein